jgi:hypothetical protein
MQFKRKKYSKFFDKPKKSAIQLERERKKESGLFVIFLKAQTQIQ